MRNGDSEVHEHGQIDIRSILERRKRGERDNLSTYTSIHGRRVWYSAVHSYKRERKLSSRSKREIDPTHNGTTTKRSDSCTISMEERMGMVEGGEEGEGGQWKKRDNCAHKDKMAIHQRTSHINSTIPTTIHFFIPMLCQNRVSILIYPCNPALQQLAREREGGEEEWRGSW